MSELLKTSSTKRFLLFILMFLIFTDLSIFLNIPVLRQVLGFTFFTVIPGLLILHILKLNKLGLTQRIVLSVGLSISFFMFFGLFINWVYPLFGYNTPLSTSSLTISFSVVILILAIIAYVRNRSVSFANLSDLKLNTREKAFLLVPAFFPLISIVGMYLMNTTDNNVMLMALLILIPVYGIFIAIKHEHVPERVYPPMIFLTSISLVLLLGLRSNHIIGVDAHTEYYIFQQTSHNGQWQIFTNSTLDSCLSISVLPTIYQSFLKIDSEYLFKILYAILFSISPLVVYLFSKKYIGGFYAFLASLFFMSQYVFQSTAYNPRTTLAVLFFALSVTVLFNSRLDEFSKKLLFIVFAASCIISHYSTTYIFFFVLLLTWIGMQVIRRIIFAQRKPALSPNAPTGDDPPSSTSKASTLAITQSQLKTYITFGTVVLFFIMVFFWYSQVTGVAFHAGVRFIEATFRSLPGFFLVESRGEEAAAVLGVELQTKGIPHHIEFVWSWLTIGFIAIGLLTTLVRYRQMVAFPGEEKETPKFINQKLEAEFLVCSLACSASLAASVALPHILEGYSMLRTYCQMMTVLSPFFVIGGIMVAKFLHTKWAYLVVLMVLIPYFMCNTGTMYQLFGVPRAITLNSEGQGYDKIFIHDKETFATRWLGDHAYEGARIAVDHYSWLRSYGGVGMYYASSLIEENKPIGEGYIYLRYSGVVGGKLMDRYHRWHDIAEYRDEFTERSLIYANGGSEVWK